MHRLRGDGREPRDGEFFPTRFREQRVAREGCPLPQPRERSDDRAHHHPAHRAHHGGVPGVRVRQARAGDLDGHELLRRRVARGFRGEGGGAGKEGLPGLHVHGPRHHLRARGTDRGEERVHHPAAHTDHAQRRHHAPDSRPHRVHHGGADLRGQAAAQQADLPANQRAAFTLAADEVGHRGGHDARGPRRGEQPAVRQLRHREGYAGDEGCRRRGGAKRRGSAVPGVSRQV